MSDTKKLDLEAIMSAIHLIFVLSVVCFGTIFLSLGVLLLPAVTAAFAIGREIIYKRFSVYGSVTKTFFSELKVNMGTMRYFPMQLIVIFQAAGVYAAGKTGMNFLVYPLVASSAFLLTMILYTAGYSVFCSERPDIIRVVIAMFYKPMYLLAVWVLMILAEVLAGVKLMAGLLLMGSVLILAAEAVIFLGLTSYKKAKNELTDEDMTTLGEDLIKKL